MAKSINVADAMANSDEENSRLVLKIAVDTYLTAQIVLNSGRMDNVVKLVQLYGDKDKGFASLEQEGIVVTVQRKQSYGCLPGTFLAKKGKGRENLP